MTSQPLKHASPSLKVHDFIGKYHVSASICDKLVKLHKTANKHGHVVRGAIGGPKGMVVDTNKKDSFDLGLADLPDSLILDYGVITYYKMLKKIVEKYYHSHQILQQLAAIELAESPIIQHYKPGGGFKLPHFERTNGESAKRVLVWMTYLNDVTDGGGTHFYYQNKTIHARKGLTLIWPTDFTHTHAGIISPTQDKYIITGWLNFSE